MVYSVFVAAAIAPLEHNHGTMKNKFIERKHKLCNLLVYWLFSLISQ